MQEGDSNGKEVQGETIKGHGGNTGAASQGGDGENQAILLDPIIIANVSPPCYIFTEFGHLPVRSRITAV